MAKKTTAKKVAKASKKPVKRAPAKAPGAAESIRQLDTEFMKAANAKSAGALVKAFYAPSAVLMPPTPPVVEGVAAIQGFLQGLMDSGLTSFKLETTATGSDGNLAYGRGRYSLWLWPPGGGPGQD